MFNNFSARYYQKNKDSLKVSKYFGKIKRTKRSNMVAEE